jgi:hypothetical protein
MAARVIRRGTTAMRLIGRVMAFIGTNMGLVRHQGTRAKDVRIWRLDQLVSLMVDCKYALRVFVVIFIFCVANSCQVKK